MTRFHGEFVEQSLDTLLPSGNVLPPMSNTVSLAGVLPLCEPGLFGVAGFDEFAESFLENTSPSRLSECLY